MNSRAAYSLIGILLLVFACPAAGTAGENRIPADSAVTRNFRLYYRFDDIAIDSSYLDNPHQIKTIISHLARSPKIDSITVEAYASPEGSLKRNEWLARRRAEAAREFILAHLNPGTPEPEIILRPTAEHWGGLHKEVSDKYKRHDREKVLRILEDDSVGPETKEWRLRQLDGGYTWNYLLRKYMPELRVATWICIWVPVREIEPCAPVTAPATTALSKDGVAQPAAVIKEEKSYTPSLKTNVLYDLATALNVSAEFPIGDRFSVMVEDVFPWWNWGPNGNKYCIQLWEMGIEPRWWFKPNGNMLGHYVGIYGKSAMYDFQNDTRLCYQGEYWSVGASYGYAMKLGRKLHLEFSVSLGFLQSDYRHYQPGTDYEHLYKDKYRTGTVSYFGPTKVAVSLVWPITFGKSRH